MGRKNGSDPDRKLAQCCKHGSAGERRRAFRGLYERHAGGLRYYLLRMTGSAHLADDLTQEAFLRALGSLEQFSEQSSFKTWIYSIATNLLKDHARRKAAVGAVSENTPGGQPTPADLAERNEEAQRVRDAVDALPEALRAPLVLVRFEGMKYRQAADALGITLEALRMRVHRAHMALVAALRE